MVYEEEIPSFSELIRELDILDADAGIRLETKYNGDESYIFITRSGQGFALAIYSANSSRSPGPGKRILFKRFRSLKELTTELRSLLKAPVRMFKY